MSDTIIPNVVVSMPSQQFTAARQFKSLPNGKVYIGKIDTDPTIIENQVQVYLQNEDGSVVPVAQPIIINAAGFPVYGGQIAKFVTVEGHSMAVYDSYGVQQFYFPNILKYSPDQLRQQLASGQSGMGLNLVALQQGGVAQNALQYVTPQMFGAKGDFNPATGVGTDDTAAFRMAISQALALGGREVRVPSGFKYLITQELNLGGIGYYGNDGVALIGEGVDNTIIYFRAAVDDSPCISARGGSGTNTSRAVSGLTIRPAGDQYRGVGLLLEGPCFFYADNMNIRFLSVGIKLHNNLAGQFTEFNRFSRMRIDRNTTNILYLTSSGDNSFHGNSWDNIQCQIRDGYYGLRVISNNGSRAHLYNNYFGINFFGTTTGALSKAVSMTMCNCDYSWANMTFEGDVYLQATDDSWWHCWGVFSGYNGVLRYDCPIPPRLGVPASFIFDNASSAATTGNFTEPELSLCYPQVLDMNWSNRALIGSYPGIIRTRSTSGFVNSLAFVNGEGDTSGFRFGSVADNSRLQGLKTKWVLNTLGTVLSAYNPAGTLYLNANNTTNSTLGRVFVSPSTFSPGSDNTMSCGNGGQKWTQVYATNGAINTSDATHKTDPRNPTSTELDAFYEIGQLPWVWQWLSKYSIEGDEARLHSGPTVQAAIAVMGKHGLNWTDYSCFCYDSWPEQEEIVRTWDAKPEVYETVPARPEIVKNGVVIEPATPKRQVLVSEAIEAGSEVTQEYRPAGGEYSFRKDELLAWILRSTISKQQALESRLSALEGK